MEDGVLTTKGSRNSESTDEQGGYKRYERVQRIEKDRHLTGGVYSPIYL